MRLVLLIVVVLALLGACGGESESERVITGVVDQVTGEREVEAFVVVDAVGSSHRFIPAPDLLCGGEPLDHLRAHLVERSEIAVTFERDASGIAVAIVIDHRR